MIRPRLGITLRVLTTAMASALVLAPAGAAEEEAGVLSKKAEQAETQLRQSFANLAFENFRASPLKGPIYQASAGGQIIYYAPESEHILFATVYDHTGVNVTALAQADMARSRLASLDPAQALVVGPPDAPGIIEFTDPDCPYCRALDRFWQTQAAQGRPVRRFIYFVSGIHPEAAAKAEHILCSADREASLKAIYAGQSPDTLLRCKEGADKVAADAATVRAMGVSGTPTLFLDGKMISGFQQAEIEAFLEQKQAARSVP